MKTELIMLKKAHVLLLPLVAVTILAFGNAQPVAAQRADDHGHEHANENGHNAAAHAEGNHDDHNHADEADTDSSHAGHGHDDHEHQEEKPETGDHAGHYHGEEEGEGLVQIDADELSEFGIDLQTAQTGGLDSVLRLPGEVLFNPNLVAHVTPRVPGVVQQVAKGVGDVVKIGDVLAVLASRELAQMKSAYLAGQAKLELARANFNREKKLFEQEITPEAEFLQARQAMREAEIDLQLAERELHALGLDEQQVANLPQQSDEALTRYELTAPISGTITQRHLSQGEVVPGEPDDPSFVLASIDTVWVQLTVYPRNLSQVRSGQQVRIVADNTSAVATGTIDYVSLQVREGTRTALARVVLDNSEGKWRPGQFVAGHVRLTRTQGNVVVPASALQTVEGQTVVYVQTAEGFKPRPVTVGRRHQDHVELLSGLKTGERFAATNTFTLKAEQGRGLLEHAGHVH